MRGECSPRSCLTGRGRRTRVFLQRSRHERSHPGINRVGRGVLTVPPGIGGIRGWRRGEDTPPYPSPVRGEDRNEGGGQRVDYRPRIMSFGSFACSAATAASLIPVQPKR